MRATLLVLLCACGAAPRPPVVERVVQVPTVVRCADSPPPAHIPVPKPAVCATRLCYEVADAINFAENVERLQEWVTTTWNLCKPR